MEKLFNSFRTAGELVARPGEWLTEDEMRARLPAIFADDKHVSRSNRYTYVSTMDLLRGLAKEGFHPTFATQQRTRKADMIGHTKHLIRLRRDFALDGKGEKAEVVMLNSHGGQSSVMLAGGIWRAICMNGHIIGGESIAKVHVPHKGDILDDVIEGAFTVVEGLTKVGDNVETWKALPLAREEQRLLAEGAATIRFDLDPGEQSPVSTDQILHPRRFEDRRDDLWTVYNRVQENLNKGGLYGMKRDANNRLRHLTTRPIKGIDQNLALNRALWTLAEGMAAIKQGKETTLPVIEAEYRDAD